MFLWKIPDFIFGYIGDLCHNISQNFSSYTTRRNQAAWHDFNEKPPIQYMWLRFENFLVARLAKEAWKLAIRCNSEFVDIGVLSVKKTTNVCKFFTFCITWARKFQPMTRMVVARIKKIAFVFYSIKSWDSSEFGFLWFFVRKWFYTKHKSSENDCNSGTIIKRSQFST